MGAPDPTDRQIRAEVYRLTRTYLEIERGLRPPEQLERFLTPAEYRRHRDQPRHPASRTPDPVLPGDIGHIHLDTSLPGQLTATVATREAGDRWGAVVLHAARSHTGRWRIDQLERLTRPSVARDPRREPTPHKDLDTRIREVQDERRLADAAHSATTSRIRDLRAAGADTQQLRHLRDQQRSWKRRRRELDDELVALKQTRGLRARLADVDHPQPPPIHSPDGDQIGRLLGALLATAGSAAHDGLTEAVGSYRRRWNVTDPHSILGPEPTDPTQQRERADLADRLRTEARTRRTSRPSPSDEATARNRLSEPPDLALGR